MSKSLKERYETSPLFGGNAPYVEAFYEQYLEDPASVGDELRGYFDSIGDGAREVPRGPVEREMAARAGRAKASSAPVPETVLEKQAAVLKLIEAYRMRGHRLARLDPLGIVRPDPTPELDPGFFGLGPADDDMEFATGGFGGRPRLKFREIREQPARVYSGTVAAELAHIPDTAERLWPQGRFEQPAPSST